MFNALTGDGGILASGVLPEVGTATEEGAKAVHEALNGETTKLKKPPKKKENKEAEVVEPKDAKTQLSEIKPEVLKSATDARKYALALKHLSYSGELVSGMMKFSEKMEGVYEKATALLASGVNEKEEKYEKLMVIIKDKLNWYKQAEAWIVFS